MISKLEVRNKVVEYLESRGRSYRELNSVPQIQLNRQEEIAWGPHKGKKDDVFVISYVQGEGPMTELIFVHASAYTGEVYFSRGPMNYLEELEMLGDAIVEAEQKFVEEIFAEIFETGDFSLYDGTRHALIYESEEFNLEFQYDFLHERMNYGGMYVRLMENENAYRLQELVEFFDPENKTWQAITKSYKENNDILLRIHAGVIQSHLMAVLTSDDISWESAFKSFLKTKQPY